MPIPSVIGPLLVLMAAAMLTSVDAQARQRIEASDGDTVTIRVSQTDLTRIGIEGGRVKRLLGVQNTADVHTDPDRGEIAIRPRVSTPFSFFLTTDAGETFTVLATPVSIPSETVVIRVRRRDSDTSSPAGPATDPHVARIKQMVRAMARGDLDYYRVPVQETVALWEGFEFKLLARWPGALIGEEFELLNATGDEQRLAEREFATLGDDVVAVAVGDQRLAPGARTRVYVIRKPKD